MAQCTQLLQSAAAAAQSLRPLPASPSPASVIWAPLVQAPLQAAAATTPMALALAHHPQLPPILFHHPILQGSGSFRDPPGGQPRGFHISGNAASAAVVSGSPARVDTPVLASALGVQHLSAAPGTSPTLPSQATFTAGSQPLAPPLPQSIHQPFPHHPPPPPQCSIPPAFPVSQTSLSSISCTAQLHPHPQPTDSFHGLPGPPGRLAPGRFPGGPSTSTISPLIASSVSPILSQLQQSSHHQQGSHHHQQSSHASTQQMACYEAVVSTSSGLSISNFPLITSTQSAGGGHWVAAEQPLAGSVMGFGASASPTPHSQTSGLQSAFLPQVLPEHSALALLAEYGYGSGDGSPCCTPPVRSPSNRSPARVRTAHPAGDDSPPPSSSGTSSSYGPLLTPQMLLCPSWVPSGPRERTPESALADLPSQEIKTISQCAKPHQGALGASSLAEVPGGVSGSHKEQGIDAHHQYLGVHRSPYRTSPSETVETEHTQSKLPSNL